MIDKIASLNSVGYVNMGDGLNAPSVLKAMKILGEDAALVGGYVVAKGVLNDALNTTALSGLTLAATANTSSKIENVMDADTWIDAASTNWKIASTKLQINTAGSPAVVLSKAVTISGANYAVLKVNATLGTGSIKYEVSRDGGENFAEVKPGHGVFIGNQPAGTDIVARFTITGNATLSKFGLAFR